MKRCPHCGKYNNNNIKECGNPWCEKPLPPPNSADMEITKVKKVIEFLNSLEVILWVAQFIFIGWIFTNLGWMPGGKAFNAYALIFLFGFPFVIPFIISTIDDNLTTVQELEEQKRRRDHPLDII
jgi:hypothetical protein